MENLQGVLEKPAMSFNCMDHGRVQSLFQGVERLELDLPVVDASEGLLQALEVFDQLVAPVGFEEPSEKLQEVSELFAVDAQTVELCSLGIFGESMAVFEQSPVGLEDSRRCDWGDLS